MLWFSPPTVLAKCIVQLELVNVVGVVVRAHGKRLNDDHVGHWLDMLASVFSFANAFNCKLDLRRHLWRAGFMQSVGMDAERPPSLLSQEVQGIQSYYGIVLDLYAQQDGDASGNAVEERLVSICKRILDRYTALCKFDGPGKKLDEELDEIQESDIAREMGMFTPLVQQVLDSWSKVEKSKFVKHLPWLFPALTNLIRSSRRVAILNKVADLLETKVQPLLS
jgi:hypothetical protein